VSKWANSAVRAIVKNARYTGYEVWNKQRKDEVLLDVEDVALGHVTRMRWNDSSEWVTSAVPMHEAIISRETFEAAQSMFDSAKRTSTRTPT
jgi:site-specific DNA recombinase